MAGPLPVNTMQPTLQDLENSRGFLRAAQQPNSATSLVNVDGHALTNQEIADGIRNAVINGTLPFGRICNNPTYHQVARLWARAHSLPTAQLEKELQGAIAQGITKVFMPHSNLSIYRSEVANDVLNKVQ